MISSLCELIFEPILEFESSEKVDSSDEKASR
jgi:hypothetical protein